MNDLNPQQIVLLTLLVSFVTSIATGITTVSLLEQAPEPVTQTINRVVEKTIERVVMEPQEDNKEEKPVDKEVVTIIVNEEDRMIEAIEKNSKSIVRIYEKVGDLKNFVAIGVIVSDTGELVTDASVIKEDGKYVGVYDSGEFQLIASPKNSEYSFIKMNIDPSSDNTNTEKSFAVANFADSSAIKLGQTAISLSGSSENKVSTGIITTLNDGAITTSVDNKNVLAGSVILNLSGEIIGIVANPDKTIPATFTASNIVKDFLII